MTTKLIIARHGNTFDKGDVCVRCGLHTDLPLSVSGNAQAVLMGKFFKLKNINPDVVFTSNFLEHLPSKSHIEKTIIQAKRCLKPGGRLICLGPNIKYLPGLYWDFWDHHIQITENSLSELLKIHDFLIEKCIAKFLPFTMANEKPPPLFFLRFYLAFPVTWRVFGKQFLVVARNSKSG